MASENKDELFDFEKTEKTSNKDNKKMGKKASMAAMAGAAAVAGGATAVGAEAAMSLADEEIIDPEMVNEAIAESTVEPARQQAHNHAQAHHAAPTQEHLEHVGAAAQNVSAGVAEGEEQPEDAVEPALDESDTPAPLVDGVEEDVEVEDVEVPVDVTLESVSDEDIAMIIDEDVTVEPDDVPVPLVEPFVEDDGVLLSDATATDLDDENLFGDSEPTYIDDLLV